MFFLKKLKSKKESNKMSTLDEVRKAYEDLSEEDKHSFHQSIADRIHESIGEQEELDGDKDSQSAKDREHEALGAEHADGKGEVYKLHETDEEDYDKDEKDKMYEARFKALEDKIAFIEKSEKSKLDSAREKYGLSSKGNVEKPKKEYTDEDVRRLLG